MLDSGLTICHPVWALRLIHFGLWKGGGRRTMLGAELKLKLKFLRKQKFLCQNNTEMNVIKKIIKNWSHNVAVTI